MGPLAAVLGLLTAPGPAQAARVAPVPATELAWLEERAGAGGVPDSADLARAEAVGALCERARPRRLDAIIASRVHVLRLRHRHLVTDSLAQAAEELARLADRDSAGISTRVRALAHLQAAECRAEIDATDEAWEHAMTARRLGLGSPGELSARDRARIASVSGWVAFKHAWLAEADSLFRLGLSIFAGAGPADDPEEGVLLERLAIVVAVRGDIPRSLELVRDAAAQLDRAAGRRDERCLRARGTLANRLRLTGRLAQAMDLLRADMDSLERAGLAHTQASLYTRWMFSPLLTDMGDRDGALAARAEYVHVAERLTGRSGPLWLAASAELAPHLAAAGRFEEARVLSESALAHGADSAFGPRSGADLRFVLARTQLAQGLTAQARNRLHEAEALLRGLDQRDGTDPLGLASMWIEVAWAEGDTTRIAAAESVCTMARRIFPIAGPERIGFEQEALGYQLWAGADTALITPALESARTFQQLQESLIPALDEAELAQFLEHTTHPLDLLLSLTLRLRSRGLEGAARLYEEALRHRGLVRAQLARRASRAADPESLVTLRAEVARRVLMASRRDAPAQEVWRADSLRRLLAGLTRGRDAERRGVSPESLGAAARLPRASAMVSYFRFTRQDEDRGVSRYPRPDTLEYLAFVRRAGEDRIRVIPLGGAAAIDSLADAWSAHLRRPGDPKGADAAGTRLRARVWDPVALELEGIRRVFIVADGPLLRVNVPALRGRDRRYLIEHDLVMHTLTDERDLSVDRDPRTAEAAVAVGGVDFSLRPQAVAESPGVRERAARPNCRDLSQFVFPPLPASRHEAARVIDLVRRSGERECVLSLGAEATEAFVRRELPRCRWLHLATHAFFLSEDCTGAEPLDRLVRRNPLVYSGIALAGADHHRLAATAVDDGLLTAEELCGLDLRGMEWAVLSGCETGLGLTARWEPVDGLRRALRQAGVRTAIMSLCPVEDEATSYWMEQLYRARFQRHEDTALAVRSASRATLAMLRRLGRPDDPRLWGAFVAVGDWR